MFSNRSIRVRVPATSANLGPGFDSLGLAFELYNYLQLEVVVEDSLSVTGEGKSELRAKNTTIAHQAAHRVFEILELDAPGVHLSLENDIPLARGLGSSSAAIIGGLYAANQWSLLESGRSLGRAELIDLANEIEGHPDNVAPALLGGLVASAVNESGRVSAVAATVECFPQFAVWIPETQLETKTARGVLPDSYSRADAIFNLSRSALLIAALGSGDFAALREALRDKIHQDYRSPLVPGFDGLTQAAMESGALGVTLSGAGPSVLFWMDEDDTQVGPAVRDRAGELGIPGRLLELRVDTLGCQAI